MVLASLQTDRDAAVAGYEQPPTNPADPVRAKYAAEALSIAGEYGHRLLGACARDTLSDAASGMIPDPVEDRRG